MFYFILFLNLIYHLSCHNCVLASVYLNATITNTNIGGKAPMSSDPAPKGKVDKIIHFYGKRITTKAQRDARPFFTISHPDPPNGPCSAWVLDFTCKEESLSSDEISKRVKTLFQNLMKQYFTKHKGFGEYIQISKIFTNNSRCYHYAYYSAPLILDTLAETIADPGFTEMHASTSAHFLGFPGVNMLVLFNRDPFDRINNPTRSIRRQILNYPSPAKLSTDGFPGGFRHFIPLFVLTYNHAGSCYLISAMLFLCSVVGPLTDLLFLRLESDGIADTFEELITKLKQNGDSKDRDLLTNSVFWSSCQVLKLLTTCFLSLQSSQYTYPGGEIPLINFATLETQLSRMTFPGINDQLRRGSQEDPDLIFRIFLTAADHFFSTLRKIKNVDSILPSATRSMAFIDKIQITNRREFQCVHCNTKRPATNAELHCPGIFKVHATGPNGKVSVLELIESSCLITDLQTRCPNICCPTNIPAEDSALFGLSDANLKFTPDLSNQFILYYSPYYFEGGSNKLAQQIFNCGPFDYRGKTYTPVCFIIATNCLGMSNLNISAGHYETVFVEHIGEQILCFRCCNMPGGSKLGTFPMPDCKTFDALTERIGPYVRYVYYEINPSGNADADELMEVPYTDDEVRSMHKAKTVMQTLDIKKAAELYDDTCEGYFNLLSHAIRVKLSDGEKAREEFIATYADSWKDTGTDGDD